MSYIQIVHELPGRTRLRSPLLRRDDARCEQVADALAEQEGVREVVCRPYTGSVLVQHAPTLVADALADVAANVLDVYVLSRGAHPPLTTSVPPFSSVARKLVQAFREIDRDVRAKSDGAVDLGTLVTLGLFGAGAAEVAVTGKLPLPPWFNLAWWGYRTFMTAEREEIEADDETPPTPG